MQRRHYKVQTWEDAEDFLTQLAKSSGRLLRGGEPDLNTTAKGMLYDWQRGKIPFFTLPPDYEIREPQAESMEDEAPQVGSPSQIWSLLIVLLWMTLGTTARSAFVWEAVDAKSKRTSDWPNGCIESWTPTWSPIPKCHVQDIWEILVEMFLKASSTPFSFLFGPDLQDPARCKMKSRIAW